MKNVFIDYNKELMRLTLMTFNKENTEKKNIMAVFFCQIR